MLLSRELDDQTLTLYNIDTQTTTTFNETAKKIWELLDEDHSLKEIVEILQAEYNVNGKELMKDVNKFITRCNNLKLLI